MKYIVSIILASSIAFSSFAASTNYTIDGQAVENIIQNASENTTLGLNSVLMNNQRLGEQDTYSSKNATTAVVLALLLGEIGVHRLYLGTTTGVFLAYACTGGGCGALWVVDSLLLVVALLEDGSVAPFIDNPNLFMWMN